MTKSLLGGGAAAAALLSISLFFQPQPSVAETLASASQDQQQQPQQAGVVSRDASVATPPVENPPTHREAGEPEATKKLNADKTAEEVVNTGKSASPVPDATGLNQPMQSFIATAYCLRGRTASGRFVGKGIIAADRKVLPLGTRVRIDAGAYSGEYLVADTGGAIRGRRIDIWLPTGSEAMRFGRRSVKLTVLSYGGRRATMSPARGRSGRT
jgi:3D (Asp-Asp-Asp) domain-containing protein